MENFIETLRWRGMLHQIMPGTEEHLLKEKRKAYIGFDPTASSLHLGNLATIMLLVHFQKAGHQPYFLIGGATGMIGDPSGKSAERNLLSEEILLENQAGIKSQLEKFFDFTSINNPAKMVNNYDWFSQFSFLGFLREVGKHLSVNYMLAKDSVQKRLETGISFTEFSYQLIQGYDFYHLWKNEGITLQMGGSDQWGNITSGTELIRRMSEENTGEAFALTTPLLTKSDGTKFGKSESGNIWLNPELTSPFKMYQFLLNAADVDAPKFLKVFSLKTKEEIEQIIAEHLQAPHLRIIQKALASDVLTLVHGKEELEKAIKASEILFGKDNVEAIAALDEQLLLQVFEGVPMPEVHPETLELDFTTFLSTGTNNIIFTSKSEARKGIAANSITINGKKLSSTDEIAAHTSLLHNKYLLVRKGKKNYFLVKVLN